MNTTKEQDELMIKVSEFFKNVTDKQGRLLDHKTMYTGFPWKTRFTKDGFNVMYNWFIEGYTQ